jgi:hypothetical protein
MPVTEKSFLGIATVWVRPYGSKLARRAVGNVTKAVLKENISQIKEPDFRRAGGGTNRRVDRVESVALSMTWMSWEAANVALAIGGTASDVVANAAIVDEVAVGFRGSLVRLAHPPTAIAAVKNSAGSSTYVPGTDYQVTAAGLLIPDGSAIVDPVVTNGVPAANLKVSYSSPAYSRIEAATKTSTELEVLIEGLNEADSLKPVLIDAWRVSLPPAAELALLGTAMGELTFEAELLKDSTQPLGKSPFFRVDAVT